MVAGFESWQRLFKRHVLKGEKRDQNISSCPYKKGNPAGCHRSITHQPIRDAQGNIVREKVQITIPAFRPVSVFDVSQTGENHFQSAMSTGIDWRS